MLSQDDGFPDPIILDDSYEVDGVTLGPQVSTPFGLILDETLFLLIPFTPLVTGHQGTSIPFILWLDDIF